VEIPEQRSLETAESELATRRGRFRAVAFREPAGQGDGGAEHLALVHGDPSGADDVLVRVHSECLTGDVFGALRCECGAQLDSALDAVLAQPCGVVVYLRGHEGRGIGLLAKVRTHVLQDAGLDTVDSATALGLPVDTRDFRAAAQVLRHLGVRSVRLLSNNPDKEEALTRHGVVVSAMVPLLEPADEHNRAYLTAKRDRLGHRLPHLDTALG
jgi:3,4-dihydroxy 2-butanone 4-phosphate synthase/GTP cyclohydrolase II